MPKKEKTIRLANLVITPFQQESVLAVVEVSIVKAAEWLKQQAIVKSISPLFDNMEYVACRVDYDESDHTNDDGVLFYTGGDDLVETHFPEKENEDTYNRLHDDEWVPISHDLDFGDSDNYALYGYKRYVSGNWIYWTAYCDGDQWETEGLCNEHLSRLLASLAQDRDTEKSHKNIVGKRHQRSIKTIVDATE